MARDAHRRGVSGTGQPLLDRLRGAPLVIQLALLGVTLTVLVVGAAFVALRLRAGRDARRVFATELAASARSLQQIQDERLRLLLATSNLVSTSPTLRAALATLRLESGGRRARHAELAATVDREVERIFTDLNRGLLAVTDDRGIVIAAASRDSAALVPGEDLSRLPAVRHALGADLPVADSSFGVLDVHGVPHQVGCVAVLLQGYPIGVLVLGDPLPRVLERLGPASVGPLVVAAGDRLVATSPGAPAMAEPAGLGHLPMDAKIHQVQLGEEDYVAAALPLGLTESGDPARLYILRSLSRAVGPLTGALGRSFVLAGALAIIAVGAGALGLSRAALRPLSQFVGVLESGADQRTLRRFSRSGGPAEIRTLSDAYNRLVDAVAEQHTQLEQRRVELVVTNKTLREEIRERERAEQALHESEEQLRQSQKLEALGTLAGGVAHDFNNLLTVITGYADLLRIAMQDDEARDDLVQIREAALRATTLVRQLLAFSRKQVLQPRILDLNEVVSGFESLLRRLIGAHIDLQVRLAERLPRVKADPGQLEQVVMNLVVNARDAMPQGGTLVIETAAVTLDEKYEQRPEAIPGGPAVMLTVSDSGVGMDAETRARIFEPFFTTKPVGEGTGLGLSTVYGIVRQTGGSISVYSEPGRGTTFRIYLPTVGEHAEVAALPEGSHNGGSGSETILVAEDDGHVRTLVRRGLEARGYRVLEAAHGEEALALAADHNGPIDLLVTDVVMPRVGGPALAERLRASRPDLQVVFLSGYSADAVARRGALGPGVSFVQKPLRPDELARVVRHALDEKS